MRLFNKYKALSLPAKAGIWFVLVNFFTKGISFITVPIFTRYLSTEEYGKVGIFMTYQGILINFATFEMYSGAYIRGILRYKDDIGFFTCSEQLLSTLITLAVFLISIPIMPWFIINAQINPTIYLLMYGYFLFFPAYECWVGRKRFEYNYRPVVLSAVFYSLASTLIPLLAVIKIEATAAVRLQYMLIPQILFCLPFYLRHANIGRLAGQGDRVLEQWRFLLAFQAPSVVHALSYIILASVDRIMIGRMVGNSQAGIYTVATTIANVITILSISANQVLKPWRYQRMEAGGYRAIRDNSRYLLIAFGAAIAMWILVAPDIMRLLFRPEYHEAVWIVPPVSMSVFFIFLYSMFVDIEEYFYRTKYTMYATTISAVANIVLNYFGIRLFGYIACAYTTLICYVLLAALHLYWSNKTVREHGMGIDRIFDVRFICVLSVLLLATETVVTLTYDNAFVRYGLVLAVVIVGLSNIGRIKTVVRTIRNL